MASEIRRLDYVLFVGRILRAYPSTDYASRRRGSSSSTRDYMRD